MAWNIYPNNITTYTTRLDRYNYLGPGPLFWMPQHCFNSSSYLTPQKDSPIIASVGDNEVTDAVDSYLTTLFEY